MTAHGSEVWFSWTPQIQALRHPDCLPPLTTSSHWPWTDFTRSRNSGVTSAARPYHQLGHPRSAPSHRSVYSRRPHSYVTLEDLHEQHEFKTALRYIARLKDVLGTWRSTVQNIVGSKKNNEWNVSVLWCNVCVWWTCLLLYLYYNLIFETLTQLNSKMQL